MKGLFIPGITVEMFRSGCLESIEALMAEGEIYDIEYEPERKTGKWMNLQLIPDDITGHTYGECSICLKLRKVDNFCPNCGAEMEVVE